MTTLAPFLLGWLCCTIYARMRIRWYQDNHNDCQENPTGLQAWHTADKLKRIISGW